MKYAYLVYEYNYGRESAPIALLSSEKKAKEYCQMEGREKILLDDPKDTSYGINRSGYWLHSLHYEKKEII